MEKLQWSELNTERYYQYLNNIINNRGQWNIPEGEYKEGHHIILRCLGGTGNTHSKDPNIIWLYPEEHYIAHKILAEDNNCSSIKSAFSMMAFPRTQNMTRQILSPEEYAEARKLTSGSSHKLSEAQYQDFLNKMKKIKETGAWKGRKKTEEHKQKLKESNLGKKHNISDEGREVLKNNGYMHWNNLTPQEYQEVCNDISERTKNMYWYVDENGHQFRSKEIINDPKIKRQRIITWNASPGWKWANNGISNKQIHPGEELPDGYVWGVVPRMYITNGMKNKKIKLTEEIPPGWWKGRI